MEASPALDELVVRWRTAFRAARSAIDAAYELPGDRRTAEAHRLRDELAPTQSLLETLANDRGEPRYLPFVVSAPEARRLLGLPLEITGCVFTLEGVLVPSTSLHAAAWAAAVDELLVERGVPTFDLDRDYRLYIHGRPRLDGVRGLLASRGVRLPEGTPDDRPGTHTVRGIANRKVQVLYHLLEVHGVRAFDGSRSYLELAREAGIGSVVVSASLSTDTILALAGLSSLIDGRVEGRLETAPETLRAACDAIEVDPAASVAFVTTADGVRAAREVGFHTVFGIRGEATGADVLIGDVGELLSHGVVSG
jgi:beta-phosphoglucomutase-like phosphatase (HAD superfamily)